MEKGEIMTKKKQITKIEYDKFVKELITAYHHFDNSRNILEDLQLEYELPSYLDSTEIDDQLTTIEKLLGWTFLSEPKLLGIDADTFKKIGSSEK